MKTINLDGVDVDISVLIRDKVKIKVVNWPLHEWLVIESETFFSPYPSPKTERLFSCRNSHDKPGAAYYFENYITYKEPAKTLKPSERISDILKECGVVDFGIPEKDIIENLRHKAIIKYLDEVADDKD